MNHDARFESGSAGYANSCCAVKAWYFRTLPKKKMFCPQSGHAIWHYVTKSRPLYHCRSLRKKISALLDFQLSNLCAFKTNSNYSCAYPPTKRRVSGI
jgi:hypothetical protein